MEREILLSICIPTYNRSHYLDRCLNSIFSQITSEMPIEVILSDNCSTDNTIEIASKYSSSSKFKLIRQKENIGPIKNGLTLVKEHAKGDFCWYIGDDDYIVPGAISSLVELIQSMPEVDFYFLNFETFQSDLQLIEREIKNKVNYKILPAFENILIPPYSQIFGGELMASIFRRKIYIEGIDVNLKINDEYLSTLETSYTHCVIFANQFMKKNTMYINDIVVLADNRAREWSDKSAYLVVEQLLSLIELYKSNGVTKYISRQIDYHYISISIGSFFKFLFFTKLKYRNKISFSKYFLYILTRPIITIKTISKKLCNYILLRFHRLLNRISKL